MIYMFSLASYGEGISGGDRIYIEFARNWRKKTFVYIHTWDEGYAMCQRQGLRAGRKLEYRVHHLGIVYRAFFLVSYIARIFLGIWIGLTLKLKGGPNVIIYGSSEFWMDVLPCILIKFRYPKVTWAATWYQTAPSPLKGFSEGNRGEKYRLNALFYWLAQLPMKPLIANNADFVLVNNNEEKQQFPKLNKKGKSIVVLGAVPLQDIKRWKKANRRYQKIYDAVFQGRFHAQKGVVELIEVWKKVVEERPNAKLAMIGDGPLMNRVRSDIRKFKLDENIKLFGYVFDGHKKYKIFAQSRVVVHPAFYDSGGMASAEAMAFGIPAVGFNLKSYESYYPKGMLKVETGNLDEFAKGVLSLLENKNMAVRLGRDAGMIIEKEFAWSMRAKEVYDIIAR